MPKATASTSTERFELKSCPGGFVELRQMSYGEYMTRRQMLSNMSFKAGKNKDDFQAQMQVVNEEVTKFEFKTCIVDHNLEDDNGKKLNLGSPSGFNQLDPRIGQEIGDLIVKMNEFDAEDDAETFPEQGDSSDSQSS